MRNPAPTSYGLRHHIVDILYRGYLYACAWPKLNVSASAFGRTFVTTNWFCHGSHSNVPKLRETKTFLQWFCVFSSQKPANKNNNQNRIGAMFFHHPNQLTNFSRLPPLFLETAPWAPCCPAAPGPKSPQWILRRRGSGPWRCWSCPGPRKNWRKYLENGDPSEVVLKCFKLWYRLFVCFCWAMIYGVFVEFFCWYMNMFLQIYDLEWLLDMMR